MNRKGHPMTDDDQAKILRKKIKLIKDAVARFDRAQGCECCRNVDEWQIARNDLGKLLGFKKYSDENGYDLTIRKKGDGQNG